MRKRTINLISVEISKMVISATITAIAMNQISVVMIKMMMCQLILKVFKDIG